MQSARMSQRTRRALDTQRLVALGATPPPAVRTPFKILRGVMDKERLREQRHQQKVRVNVFIERENERMSE